MNKQRRAQLSEIDKRLVALKEDVKDILWDERDSLRNIPESFQDTERYTKIEDAVDHLEDMVEHIDQTIYHLHEAQQ